MVGIFERRAEITVDQNNNEVTVTRRRISLRRTLIATVALVFIGAVAAIGVVSSASVNKHGGASELQWAPFMERPSREQIEKLKIIRELAPHSRNEIMADDVCYTVTCLDTAIQFLLSMNTNVNPCDDFAQFSCGRWLEMNPIPSSSSRWSQFNILRDEVNNKTQTILTSPPEATDFKPLTQVKQMFSDCMNTAAIELEKLAKPIAESRALGLWPSAGGVVESFDLNAALGTLRRVYLDSPIVRVYVSEDLKNTARRVIYLDQPSFFVSRSILLNPDTENNKKVLDAYVVYYKTVALAFATEAGTTPLPTDAELESDARGIIEFEKSLAGKASADEDRTDVGRIYNLKKLDAYEAEIPAPADRKILWKTLLDDIFSSSGVTIGAAEDLIVLEQDYLKEVQALLAAAKPRDVANYVHWRLVSGLTPETTAAMRNAAFLFAQARTGQKEPTSREMVCANAALSSFGMAIGTKYIEQSFDVPSKANVDLMVTNLKKAFHQLLDGAAWMGDDTKVNARAKADAMASFMAFPDWIDNKTLLEAEYEGLEIVNGKYLDSIISLSHWAGDRTLGTLRVPTNKDYWLSYPGVVNAFYSPEFNSITFPAGILQPPFYRSKALEAVNYGGIGVVIGHEITHGFDDQGSQYDKDGNAEDWWSAADKQQFEEKAQCIIDQYSSFQTDVGNVNGKLTQGENIADNGGLREAWQAYQNWLETENKGQPEKKLPGLENYTAEQLFFLSYANIWCENITNEALNNQLLTDPHSPARFRILGALRNSATFAEKWECPAGSAMNPANKCIVW